ncbi:cell division transport system permease protein [Geomicrobium halophilum]|uniref:Cell division protein FtsX n=1 Tax=Geomicrobium halophilum TaxID=549000 RepID=A0A841PT43_9BACL|nr:permease-like cell division protein FtsX [Geomicrobium halophilum]MBB6450356.1 cell division transport system permease protein [Geomicrobium halophilum]
MKRRTFARHMREGLKNIGRNGWMSFATISAVTMLLFVIGSFSVLMLNANSFISAIENEVEIRAFLELDTDSDEQQNVMQEIANASEVEEVRYLDREEGLDQFIDSLGSEGEVYESIRDENPFNDALVIQASDPELTENVAAEVNRLEEIETVEYGASILTQLFTVTNYVRIIGGVFILGMLFTTIFLISNTIKLTIISRRDEIQIMKLVGATNRFVRFPFFIEGLLIGIIGAITPIAILVTGYVYLYEFLSTQMPFITMLEPFPLVWQVSALLIGLSIIVGIWGSQMSVRKFLQV